MVSKGNDILIRINDAQICYDDLGDSAVPLILVHGFPFSKSSWKPQQDFFKDKLRVIMYDIRGYGASDPGKEEFSMQLFADDLITLMDVLRIERASVCGLSMGGYIALNAISRYQERFAHLVLCSTQCHADTAEGKEKRLKAIQLIEKGGFIEWVDATYKNLFSDFSHEHHLPAIMEIRNIMLNTSPEIVSRTLKALAERNETCFFLPEIIVPSLIISGTGDKVIPPERSELLNRNIAKSEFHTISGAGHMINLEEPDRFNRLLEQFLL